ncbi:hypothetical protein BH09BAC2_BH09BAC2_06300 [soil metagenome]
MATILIITNVTSFINYNGNDNVVILWDDDNKTSGNFFKWDTTLTAASANGGTIYAGKSGANGAWKMLFEGSISVKWFGAKGDNTNNDYTGIQGAINYAKLVKGSVYLPQGIYKTNTPIRIYNGVREFYGPGKLIFGGTTGYTGGEGVIDLDGTHFGTVNTPVSNCNISVAGIDANSVAKFCIFGGGANSEITIENIIFENIREAFAAVQLNFGCFNNTITNNRFYLPVAPDTTSTAGINIIGKNTNGGTQVYDGNYFNASGAYVTPATPNYNNSITNNYISQGSHGIQVIAGLRNLISGNICTAQSARSIIVSAGSAQNIIDSNSCTFFNSSGIHLAYNCIQNLITNNYIFAPAAEGEGGIQAYIGCSFNIIEGNYINCSSRYGVYIAISCSDNLVSENTILGFNLAGITIESDWQKTGYLPSGAVYSQVRVAPPFAGYTTHQWPYSNCNLNVISNNIIGNGYSASVAAIYLTAINGMFSSSSFSVTGTVIKDNLVTAGTMAGFLYVYQDGSISSNSGPLVSTITFNNNNFSSSNDPSKIFLPEGRKHFFEVENNSVINNGIIEFPVSISTPDVSIGRLFMCVNSSATNITNFTNGKIGQEIIIRLDVFTTIVHNNSYIKLKMGNNVTGDADNLITFINISNIWFEKSRNF